MSRCAVRVIFVAKSTVGMLLSCSRTFTIEVSFLNNWHWHRLLLYH